MSLISIDQLDMAVPDARYGNLVRYIDFLNEGMERFQINTPARMAAFIAQIAHESGDFLHVEENLTVPMPRPAVLDAYVVYVGFDSAAVSEPPPAEKKKPAPKPKRAGQQ